MYHQIYSPEGTMFEVPPSKVTRLVRKGWTLSYPEDLTKVFSPVDESNWDKEDDSIFEQFLQALSNNKPVTKA